MIVKTPGTCGGSASYYASHKREIDAEIKNKSANAPSRKRYHLGKSVDKMAG